MRECLCERKYEMKDCKEPDVCMHVSDFYIGVHCVCVCVKERESEGVSDRDIAHI